MKNWVLRLFLAAVVAGGAFYGYRAWHPSAEQAIRKEFAALARTASFPQRESTLARFSRASKLVGFCTPDVQIVMDVPGHSGQTISGRDELLAAINGAQAMAVGLAVEFVDVGVEVAPDRQSAVVSLTVRGKVSGERDMIIQELRCELKCFKGEWQISRVETVKTLL
jgi:hypothetical protein